MIFLLLTNAEHDAMRVVVDESFLIDDQFERYYHLR